MAINLTMATNSNANTSTAFNMGHIRAQIRNVAQENRGVNSRLSTDMSESTIMTSEEFLHARRTNVNARLEEMLGGRESATDAEIRSLAWSAWEYLHTPVFGGEQRGLAEMASALEEKLNEIDNDTNLSSGQRSILRQVWQEGFVRAVQGTQRVALDENIFRRGGGKSRHEAEAEVMASLAHANQIASSLESITSNTEIQELVLRGLEELITRTIARSASAFYLSLHPNGERNGNASNIVSAFRRDVTTVFASMRTQWSNTPRVSTGSARELFSSVGIS